MGFTSIHFLLFLPVAAGAYFVLPHKARRPWLLLASYYFYFFAAPRYLVVLLCGTLASFLLGLFIEAAPAGGRRKRRFILAACLLVLGLAFFKYNDFFAAFLRPAFAAVGLPYPRSYFVAGDAMGISFYTFTAIGYLADVAGGDEPAERSLLNYALFLGFFPSVTMGPINRAGSLLPQLKDDDRAFDAALAAAGLRRMAVGWFKKLAVADVVAVLAGGLYKGLDGYTGGILTLAAVAYALQLYFDFSGYSDIVVGTAQIFGIRLPENFGTPYFSTNFSGFWARWHISLSAWLQDYLFTPLVWSRWTERLPLIGKRVQKPPVLSSLAITFLVSGLWHGDTLCYLVWGGLQAVYRIGEELLHRRFGKPKKRPPLPSRIAKTAVVLVLWVESLVFFKVGSMGGSVGQALSALGRQLVPAGAGRTLRAAFAAVMDGFYSDERIAGGFVAFMLVCLVVALWADWLQCFRLKGRPLAEGIATLPGRRRWAVYLFITLCCFAGFIAQSGGFAGGSFLYEGY